MITTLLAWLYWNPNREIFRIPIIDHPVVWYAVCWIIGFSLGYLIMRPLMRQKLIDYGTNPLEASSLSTQLIDTLTWIVIVGAIVGARLGHVFFYDWDLYKAHPLEILKTWNGGLASHGGALGTLLAVFAFQRYVCQKYAPISLLEILDMMTIPAAIAGACIRIGNFINQEILGIETTVPWGVIFGDPMDGGAIVPRHPVALYEALANLCLGAILSLIWYKNKSTIKPGKLLGLFFILNFGSRFFIEYFKEHQSHLIDESFLQMGQCLSIPFILVGFILLFKRSLKKSET